VEEQRQWWDHVVDTLEVANTECQAMCVQLMGLHEAMEYISEAVYHQFVVGGEGSDEEREGAVVLERREMQEAGVATSEIPSEGTKDWGKGPSGLTTADKGKGKEVQDEETLQEE